MQFHWKVEFKFDLGVCFDKKLSFKEYIHAKLIKCA